jgi:hypothetical protein
MIGVKNIAPGPRGLHSADGPAMLRPGESAEVEMTPEELAASKATGWFIFEGQSAKETDKAFDAMSDDELRALLKEKGVVADGRWGHDKLVAEAKKAVAA